MNGRDFADGQMFASRALVESFGYSYPIPVTSGPVIRPQFRLTLDYTPGCRIALNVPKQQYAV